MKTISVVVVAIVPSGVVTDYLFCPNPNSGSRQAAVYSHFTVAWPKAKLPPTATDFMIHWIGVSATSLNKVEGKRRASTVHLQDDDDI